MAPVNLRFSKKRAQYHPPKIASSRASYSSRAEGAASRTKIASPQRREGQFTSIKHLSKVTFCRVVSVRQWCCRDRLAPTLMSACFSKTIPSVTDRMITAVRACWLCQSKKW